MNVDRAPADARHFGPPGDDTRKEPIPRHPIPGWAAFQGPRHARVPAVASSPNIVYTTSGRAAIALALGVLGLRAGDRVLVPTYHCPTMIAPVTRLGAEPVFFPVTAGGAPALETLEGRDLRGVRAMLVAHYFGLPQPLSRVREFCDARGIALIEDCAHAFFGKSEGQPIGAWGDLAIASLTKFFPVTEGGCLVSASRSLEGIALEARGAIAELKGLADVLETGARFERFPGINAVLRGVFALKELVRGRRGTRAAPAADETAASPAMDDLDETLLGARPTLTTRLIASSAHADRIVALRRRNYDLMTQLLCDLPDAAPLAPQLPEDCAPYVYPLRVGHPAERYRLLRAAKVPLFRWDRVWPGTPEMVGDHGRPWAVEMFQLACHQDLSEADIRAIASTIRRIFNEVR